MHKTQFGRSMIEMLGVLAIVGVLSVGGLAGYAKAMRTIRANDVVQYLEQLKMEYKTQSVTGALAQIEYQVTCENFVGEAPPAGIDRSKPKGGCHVEPKNAYGTNRIFMILTSSQLYLDIINKFGYECSAANLEKLRAGQRPYLRSYQLTNGRWITDCF